MLYKEAVNASTLGLLRSLQQKQYLKGFYLAGGTALALYNGHRRSVDIDLFSDFSFDTSQMLENIVQDFDFNLLFSAPNTLKGSIGDIKFDILAHRYHLIDEPVFENNIYILSEHDIVAMKLNAISTSGQRIKDFIDIYYLLEKYDLPAMLGYYQAKYDQRNDLLVLKSLIYFDDVEESEWPVMVRDPDLKWKDVKRKIRQRVIDYSRGVQLAGRRH
jgi:predicted nucleotidyltransferase component of viral defense system